MKVHTMFVIRKREMEVNDFSVRVPSKGNLGAKPITDILQAIKKHRAS